MKKILLIIGFALFSNLRSTAQCTFVSPTVEINQIISNVVPGYCDININLSFKININSGNKYTFIHLWRTGDYNTWVNTPGYAVYSSNQNSQPEYNDGNSDPLNILQNATATIIIYDNNGTLSFESSYGPDTDAPVKNSLTNPGLSVTRILQGADYFYTISNLVLRVLTPSGLTGCNSAISFTGDAWSSQANNANPPIHCAMTGFSFIVNDPVVTGMKLCTNPRTYQVTLSTTSTTPISLYYDLYVDDGDGIFDPEPGGGDKLAVANSGPYSVVSGTPYQASGLTYPLAYSNNKPWADNDLWVLVSSPGILSNLTLSNLTAPCIPLPADMKSFTAARNGTSVNLRWETMNEQNCRGFIVERNNGNGIWQEAGYVPTQAVNGNSADLLSYTFADYNDSKSMTQYRIRQVDADNRSKFSNIQAIRGLNQKGSITVYPNPSSNGNVNVVFEEKNSVKEITVVDMSGRAIRQMKNVSVNNIVIENLQSGMYTLRVYIPATGEQMVEKLVVNRK